MTSSQWIALAALFLVFADLVYAFIRSGRIESDKSHDAASAADWSDHSGHGADSSGH